MYICNACGVNHNQTSDFDMREHDDENPPVECNECHRGEYEWEVEDGREVSFCYIRQAYFDADNQEVEEEDNWNFSCPKCTSPSELTHYDAYYEYHTCLKDVGGCGHKFTVN